jgi:hypothetical protein
MYYLPFLKLNITYINNTINCCESACSRNMLIVTKQDQNYSALFYICGSEAATESEDHS